MKLTLDKFKQRHIFIKEQKKDKIPNQCFDCYYLNLFKKDNIYYYTCGEVFNPTSQNFILKTNDRDSNIHIIKEGYKLYGVYFSEYSINNKKLITHKKNFKQALKLSKSLQFIYNCGFDCAKDMYSEN